MKVFIGWSGPQSKLIALALREWLPKVIQALTPWMSEEDLRAGSVWGTALSKELEETNFGIIALTRENLGAPWINFEAGALSKQVGKAAVCPYLIDFTKNTEVVGPLEQFHSKMATEEGTLGLLKEVNRFVGDSKLTEQILTSTFERWWPDLKKAIENLPVATAPPPKRSERELLEEIVERVRSLDRQASAFPRPPVPSPPSRDRTGLTNWLASQPSLADEELQRYLALLGAESLQFFNKAIHAKPSAKASKPATSEGKKNGGAGKDN